MCSQEGKGTENREFTYGLTLLNNSTLTLFCGISTRLCKLSFPEPLSLVFRFSVKFDIKLLRNGMVVYDMVLEKTE